MTRFVLLHLDFYLEELAMINLRFVEDAVLPGPTGAPQP